MDRGGAFVTTDPKNNNKKSAIDFIIVSTDLVKYIERFEIDNDLKWTPSRPTKDGLKFTDHYALHLVLNNIPMKKVDSKPVRKEVKWNIKRNNGWNKYRELTEVNERLASAASIENENPQIILKVIEKEMTKVKHKAFGKVKLSSKSKDEKMLEALQVKKNDILGSEKDTGENKVEEIEKEMKSVMMKIQKNKFSKEVKALENIKNQ